MTATGDTAFGTPGPTTATTAASANNKIMAMRPTATGRLLDSGAPTDAADFINTNNSLMAMEWQYFKAVSLYRRRNYEKCVEVCNFMLQEFHEHNVQMFTAPPDDEDALQNSLAAHHHHHQYQHQHQQHHHHHIANNGGGGSSGGSGPSHAVNHRVYSSNSQRSTVISSARGQLQQQQLQQQQQQQYGGGHFNSSNTFFNNNYFHNSNNNNNNLLNAGTNQMPTTATTTTKTPMTAAAIAAVLPTWLMEDVWQLKMRALTQRVYIDDLETNDDMDAGSEEIELERIATTARPGTSIKNTFVPRPSTSTLRSRLATGSSTASQGRRPPLTSSGSTAALSRPSSSLSTRPSSGMARPGTGLSRPGSSLGSSRPASRCGTASRVRASSAAAFNVGDATASLYQASRLNPTIYAERQVLVKALFHFLFYHEAEVQKAYSLCEAVMDVQKQRRNKNQPKTSSVDWWWLQQIGRCLLTLRYPRKAENFLQESLELFPHPDTYLLLSRLYQRLDQSERAMQLINSAADRHPFDVIFRTEQGRLFDAMSKPDDAIQIYRLISRLNPINVEALACIALNYFYDNNPEMALMYYRRILSLGVHSAELYCNIALCCLYSGQVDFVLPCFQRALKSCRAPEQKADIWYNLSFVAITTGDFNLAKRCLQLCLSSDGQNGAALNNLAVISAHNGEIMKAKSYLVAAKEVLQDSMEIDTNLLYMDKYYKL